MIAVVDRPQTILSVHNQAQYGVEQVRLNGSTRIGDGGAGHPLEQLVALRSRFRMYGKENSALGIDGDVADRLAVIQDFLQTVRIDLGFGAEVGVRFAAAVAEV